MKDKEEIRESIRKDYSDVAKGASKGCCGGGLGCCSTIEIKNASLTMGYSKEDLKEMPLGANMGLGCGNPIAIALLKEGKGFWTWEAEEASILSWPEEKWARRGSSSGSI